MSNYQKTKITYRSSFWGSVALAIVAASFGGLPAWATLPISAICLILSAALLCYAASAAYGGDRDRAYFTCGIAAILACLSAPWGLDLAGRLLGRAASVPWWVSFLQLAAAAIVLRLVRGNGDDPVTPLTDSATTNVPASGRWFDPSLLSIVLAAAAVSGLAAGSALARFGLTADLLGPSF